MSDLETVKSYNIAHTSFESSFMALAKRAAMDLSVKPPRRDAAPEPTPNWVACAKTVLNVVGKNKSALEVFERRVRELFERHSAELVLPIFKEDGSVNDQFLKSRLSFLPYGSSLSGIEGPVVFLSDNLTTETVCVAIGEIYRACIAEHLAAAEANVPRRLLPTLTLLDWYSMLYHAMSEESEHKEALAQNVIDLCHAAEEQAPGTGPGSRANEETPDSGLSSMENAQLDGLMNMVSGVVSTFGGAHTDTINSTLGKFRNVLGTMYKDLSANAIPADGRPPSVADIISRIGEVLHTPKIQKEIEDFSSEASTLLSSMGIVPGAAAGASQPPSGPKQLQ